MVSVLLGLMLLCIVLLIFHQPCFVRQPLHAPQARKICMCHSSSSKIRSAVRACRPQQNCLSETLDALSWGSNCYLPLSRTPYTVNNVYKSLPWIYDNNIYSRMPLVDNRDFAC